MADIAVLDHQAAVFGAARSDSTDRPVLAELDAKAFARIAKARVTVRQHAWGLLADREQGFPWIVTAGRILSGWVVMRLLGLANEPDLAGAEIATLRFRLLHIPGRLVHHARDKILRIPADWPWASAFTTCLRRLATLPDPG